MVGAVVQEGQISERVKAKSWTWRITDSIKAWTYT